MKRRFFLLLGLLLGIVSVCFSQTYSSQDANGFINNAELVKFKNYSKVPNYVRFSANETPTQQQAIAIVKSFITNANADLQMKEVQNNGDGSQTIRYYQTVSGYPIEFSALNLQVKNGRVSGFNGEILDNPQITPSFLISEADALQFALNYVNAEAYMWQEDTSYCPHGEQVIVPDKIYFRNSKLKSAYKFSIYTLKPYDGKRIYVDAETGEIILDIPLIHFSNVVGTAQTAYYGTRSINTDYNGSQYTLRDSTRGKGIFTYNANDEGNYTYATDFSNNSTTWSGSQTQYGTDAHFSTMMTYDYYLQIHGRNSINDSGFALRSYVHYNLIKSGNYSTNVNAFWNGKYMTYGDGDPDRNITPLTTIDICGHEITHGLTEKTANLVYASESGAMNEAFSDIFGKAIEQFAVPQYASWLMGEKIGYVMRSMSNPKLYSQPSTYGGANWWNPSDMSWDNGGVHRNSGVLNYWFYLLCAGGSGTNDNGNKYSVTKIGMEKAEKITFRLLTHYLSSTSEYEDACFYGLQAVTDLYGACSDELKAVGDAFYAIGLLEHPYEKHAVAAFSANITESCDYPLSVKFTNQSYNCSSYLWDFGDGTSSAQTNPSHTYTANGNYTVTLTVNSGDCGTDTAIKQNYIKISPDLPCIYFMTQGTKTVNSCHGIIYDDGGPDKPHSSDLTSRLTVCSPGASAIVLKFWEFDLEACSCDCDRLSIYRGNSTASSARVGTYCNYNRPGSELTINRDTITFLFNSDPYVNLDGFKIEFICINPNNPPIAFFDADKTNTCDGIINFKDQSIAAQIDTWLWDFGDGTTSTLQNPTHQYLANGAYSVSLTAGNANGEHTLTKPYFIAIYEMIELSDYQFKGFGEPFELQIPDATSNLKWYENKPSDILTATPIFIGNIIQHPAVSDNKMYYILDSYVGEEYHIGETVCSETGSFFDANVVHYLIFDAYKKFNLKSLLVNAGTSANRSIMLRDYLGNVIWTKTVNIPKGTSRIAIDMEVPIGANLQLACNSYPNLFRSNTSANLHYPYAVEDVVSIKTSSAGAPDDLKYYYFFYDWEIKLPDCNSELSTVTITLDEGIQDNSLKNVAIMPNPSRGIFRIENLQNVENHTITVSEVTGKILNAPHLIQGNIIDLSPFATGIYFVKIDDKVFKVAKY